MTTRLIDPDLERYIDERDRKARVRALEKPQSTFSLAAAGGFGGHVWDGVGIGALKARTCGRPSCLVCRGAS